jgi:hypothetical protein
VLEQRLGDESLLMVSCGHAAIAPEIVPVARMLLDRDGAGGGD